MSARTPDLWTEQRDEIAVLIRQLQPNETLEVLQHIATRCPDEQVLVPMLIGIIPALWSGARLSSDVSASEAGVQPAELVRRAGFVATISIISGFLFWLFVEASLLESYTISVALFIGLLTLAFRGEIRNAD